MAHDGTQWHTFWAGHSWCNSLFHNMLHAVLTPKACRLRPMAPADRLKAAPIHTDWHNLHGIRLAIPNSPLKNSVRAFLLRLGTASPSKRRAISRSSGGRGCAEPFFNGLLKALRSHGKRGSNPRVAGGGNTSHSCENTAGEAAGPPECTPNLSSSYGGPPASAAEMVLQQARRENP